MGTWQTIIAALSSVPTITKALTEIVAIVGKLVEVQQRVALELERQRKIKEFEAGRRLSRETGDTSELERALGKRL